MPALSPDSHPWQPRLPIGGKGNSLVVQWLGPHASTAGACVLSLVRELRAPKTLWQGQNQTNKIRGKKNRSGKTFLLFQSQKLMRFKFENKQMNKTLQQLCRESV